VETEFFSEVEPHTTPNPGGCSVLSGCWVGKRVEEEAGAWPRVACVVTHPGGTGVVARDQCPALSPLHLSPEECRSAHQTTSILSQLWAPLSPELYGHQSIWVSHCLGCGRVPNQTSFLCPKARPGWFSLSLPSQVPLMPWYRLPTQLRSWGMGDPSNPQTTPASPGHAGSRLGQSSQGL
jgi:hypothetical protein